MLENYETCYMVCQCKFNCQNGKYNNTSLNYFLIDLTPFILVFICLISLREKVAVDKVIGLDSIPKSPDLMGVLLSFIMLLIKRLELKSRTVLIHIEKALAILFQTPSC